uniref:Pco088261 n=1 Tax=Arundo donax TaxID=35708 RepID=A0A0A9H9B3_ARUDO
MECIFLMKTSTC